MGTQGVGTFLVNSKWSSGTLVFYEKAYGLSTTGNILKIGTTAVQVGDTAQAVDFSWYATGGLSFVLSASDSSMTLVGCNVAIDGDIVIGTDDIAVAQGYYVYLSGLAGGEYVRSASANYIIVNGTTGVDFGIAGTAEVSLIANSLEPATSDGCALGTGTDMWSDLFLANLGVINFNNGDVTITHASNLITVAGGTLWQDDVTDTSSATTGSIQTDGGVGIAKALWVGTTSRLVGAVTMDGTLGVTGVTTASDSVNVTKTAPTAAANAIFGNVVASANWTGNLVAVRGRVTTTATGAIQSATGVHAAVKIEQTGSTGTGLTCALNAEVQSETNVNPNAIVYIQSLPHTSSANFAAVPYLVFSETVTGGTGSNILFEVGHAPAGTVPTMDSGDLFYGNTLQIAVNASAGVRTAYYIPLSTAQASYTTAYPISVGVSGGTAITIGTSTTGINVAANIVIPQLVTIGTLANPLHWDGVAPNILIYQENLDTTPGSVTANKFSLSAAQSGATTSGRLECFRSEVKSYSTTAVTADMRALVGQVEFSGDMTYQGSSTADFAGAFGVIASIWSGSDVTANSGNLGHMYPLGIFFGLETGTSLSGEDAYIYIYNFGKVCPNSVIKLYNASTPEVPTYLLDMAHGVLGSSSGPVYTGDVNPTTAPTADVLGADGHIKILVGTVPYYIPIFATLV